MSLRHKKDRKSQIEWTLREANKLRSDVAHASDGWNRLCKELEAMCEPEARLPRFKKLLDAIWRAATNEE